MRWQEGHNHDKSNPKATGGRPTNWRIIILQKFSHWSEGSEPHVRLPNLGVRQQDQESPGNLPVGFDCRTSTGLGKTKFSSQGKETFKKIYTRASLVAQWLRICLLMHGTWVRALVWEDPTCRGATGPVSHNY